MPFDLQNQQSIYSWGLDKWYPVTFISRPLPEMLFYLVLFGIQIGERMALSRDLLGTKTEPHCRHGRGSGIVCRTKYPMA